MPQAEYNWSCCCFRWKTWVFDTTLELTILSLNSRCIYSFKVLKNSNSFAPQLAIVMFHYSRTCPPLCQYRWIYRELSVDRKNFSIPGFSCVSFHESTDNEQHSQYEKLSDQVLRFMQNLFFELAYFFIVFLSVLCFIIWLWMVVKISKTAEWHLISRP